MAQIQSNDVEETIKHLKTKPGFFAYILMNNDGIVIKYENLEYQQAVMYAYHVLDLYTKSKLRVAKLIDAPDNDMESLRLHTKYHEIIIAQYLKFTIVVLQTPAAAQDGALDTDSGLLDTGLTMTPASTDP